MNAASFAFPATLIALFGLELARVVERPYWLIPALVNLVVASRARRYTRPMLNAAEDVAAVAASYTSVFAILGQQNWTSERLAALQRGLIAPAASAEQAMRRLARIGEWAAARASPMLHGALQIALLGLSCGARARRLALRVRQLCRRVVCRGCRDRVSVGVRRASGGESGFHVSSCRSQRLAAVRGARTRSSVAVRGFARGERRHCRPGWHHAAHLRLEHGGQEHAPPRRWAQRGARARRRAGVRRGVDLSAGSASDLDSSARLARARALYFMAEVARLRENQ